MLYKFKVKTPLHAQKIREFLLKQGFEGFTSLLTVVDLQSKVMVVLDTYAEYNATTAKEIAPEHLQLLVNNRNCFKVKFPSKIEAKPYWQALADKGFAMVGDLSTFIQIDTKAKRVIGLANEQMFIDEMVQYIEPEQVNELVLGLVEPTVTIRLECTLPNGESITQNVKLVDTGWTEWLACESELYDRNSQVYQHIENYRKQWVLTQLVEHCSNWSVSTDINGMLI